MRPQPWLRSPSQKPLERANERRVVQSGCRSLEQATVGVIDYEFGGATSAERQRVVSAVLKPWLAPGVLYKRMWNSLSVGQVPPPPVPTDSSMMVIEKRQYSGE